MESGLIRFANVEIDPRIREVRRGGEPVPVQNRVFDLLVCLIAHRDRVVSKKELQDEIWPGMIVTETALTRAVMKARRAIGDDSERQALIRTVHGHGYRFIGELEPEREAGESPSAPPESPRRFPTARAWSLLGSIGLLALVAVAALLVFRPDAPNTRIAVLPVTDKTGDPELAWTGLGLMSYANRLLSEGWTGGTVPARQVISRTDGLTPEPSEDELQTLRRALGASHLVQSTLTRSGERLNLQFRVIHENGAGPPASLSGTNSTELVRQMARAVVSGLPGAGLRREFRTVSEDSFVNEAYARGLSLQLQGEVARARDYFAVAVQQEPELFWPRYELALTLRDTGDLELAREHLEALAGTAGANADAERIAAARNALAQVYWRQREYASADAEYQAAQAAAERTGDPSLVSVILVNRGILARIRGDLERARDYLALALEATERTDDPDRASIYQSLGQVEWVAGKLPLAIDYYRRAHDEFRIAGDRRGMASALNAIGRTERRMGEFADAETHMRAALEMREALGDYFGQFSSRISLAELHADMEQWEAAMEHSDRALAQATHADDAAGMADALRARAAVALAWGDMAAARADLERLEAEWPEDREEPLQFILEARLAVGEGRAADAHSIVDKIGPDAPPAVRIDILEILAAATSDRAQARRHWQEAIDLANAHSERGRAGRLLVAMTRRELEMGHIEQARANVRLLQADYGNWPGVDDLQQRVEGIETGETG